MDVTKAEQHVTAYYRPGDILHFLANKNRFNIKPSFFSGIKEGIYDDIFIKEDMKPLLGFFLAMMRYIPNINMWKRIFKR